MRERVGAILVAAGASTRMGFDKLWSPLGDRPVISYALRTLATSALIDRVALVVAAERLGDAERLVADRDWGVTVCRGGARRRDSVAAGLAALAGAEWIVVHDAARPFADGALIAHGLAAARPSGAAVAAIPARDTIKRVVGGVVMETLPRAELWNVQTPQVFWFDVLRRALESDPADVTDEATLVERLGVEVRVFQGGDANWKLTTPADFVLAEAWLARAAGLATA